MANFKPLNNYALFILDKLIDEHKLKPPFLDVACGTGYISEFLGKKGWGGKAIDFSEQAVEITKENLKLYKQVVVEKKAAEEERGKYKTILMFDLLEHIKNDKAFLKKIYSLLTPRGFLVIGVPSNPKEWRWDDEFYGHYRRYTEEALREKLVKANFKPIVYYDYTYPVFWFLRRIYTKLKNKDKLSSNIEKRTKESSFVYAWNIPIISTILDNTSFLWLPIFIVQYTLFRKNVQSGNAMLVLAKK